MADSVFSEKMSVNTAVTTDSIRVLSLNCWGLRYLSKHRARRMAYIGDVIAKSDWEIVGLQECWSYDDYKVIREKTKDLLPYGKFYFGGSIGAGLVIMSKWPIEQSSMFRYPLNGRPTAFFRGDFFVGKGVASAMIKHESGHYIEVFCTHLHAPYEEEPNDSYLCHRTAQAWEISKLLRGSVQKGHITLALGDFNMIPDSFAHKLLRSYGHMADSWLSVFPDTPAISPPTSTPEHNTQVMGLTCDSALNTWRPDPPPNPKNLDPWAKRLDYIFHSPLTTSATAAKVCFMEKLPDLKCSPSDHFGIDVTIKLTPPEKISFPSFPKDLYDDILELVDIYEKREEKQRFWRMAHFFIQIFVTIGIIIGSWWIPRAAALALWVATWLWGIGSTLDGIMGFCFFNTEIRALKEFREEIKMQKAKVERDEASGQSELADLRP
ncbi:phospholipase C type enzyme, variant 2 [Orbilia oligospora]|uniref:Phospholipase C type enzyme, variant 2 n=2 Tax=Orbilia oligospora TaxID=2813651 RepID=A0A7C8JG37_ORBOL|nr:phospholipase C type enzyme, variant 2 [Orbilia oligospora]KAF3109961.1 phospholipase C type enzyme, variant 2 [Orbilia oligospora]KAF3117040.1 phospholipase C type enzyme, variant 2 [Orbilia oligospora]